MSSDEFHENLVVLKEEIICWVSVKICLENGAAGFVRAPPINPTYVPGFSPSSKTHNTADFGFQNPENLCLADAAGIGTL